MLLEEATSFGVFRLNAPGDAELVQVCESRTPPSSGCSMKTPLALEHYGAN